MQNRSARTWGINVGVTACIAVAGVIGTAVPAQSVGFPAATTATHSRTADRSGVSVAATRSLSAGATTSTTTGTVGSRSAGITTIEGETRSWATLIRTAVNALKKIPALWKKVVDGAKRSLAWFKSNVWPSIKATVNLVSALLTAQEIWKFFN